jgi:hypothetical protein
MATDTSTLTEKATSLFELLGEGSIKDVAVGPREHPLTKAANSQALSSNIGKIVLAGSSPSGSKWVQFNADGGSGFASTWPQWAFEIAKDALLNNVKVWVIANGDPFGSNLTQVLLYAP